ncbi:MAG: hypothetical protein FWC68_02415, partial [Oscillospiraceae bacterium]|nr:hypothetical protein [Oscillospiraceae bacterium]
DAVTINQSTGTITGRHAGTATVRATSVCRPNIYAEARITVVNPPPPPRPTQGASLQSQIQQIQRQIQELQQQLRQGIQGLQQQIQLQLEIQRLQRRLEQLFIILLTTTYQVDLQFHSVLIGPFQHASVVVHGYRGNPDFPQVAGTNFFTLGAANRGGRLTAGPNRSTDANVSRYTVMLSLGRWDAEAIERMLTAFDNYGNNAIYSAFPRWPGNYNSNSFVRGLLEASGFRVNDMVTVNGVLAPGWNRPVPRHYFR